MTVNLKKSRCKGNKTNITHFKKMLAYRNILCYHHKHTLNIVLRSEDKTLWK